MSSFPEKDKCPKVCTDIGAFKKAAKSPGQAKEEIKALEENKTKELETSDQQQPCSRRTRT